MTCGRACSRLAEQMRASLCSRSIAAMLFALLALTMGCTGRGGRAVGGFPADSIYTWENIRQHIIEQPKRAFGLVDTAEMRGLADVNYANWMRAQIYYGSPKAEDLDKARELCMGILDNQNP
ncbi:MAG: hypothetical protein IJT75_03615, partial [Bacteroidaceae bacterium]|nr:hypothetical protein [Bacteroidaceae bacterium]